MTYSNESAYPKRQQSARRWICHLNRGKQVLNGKVSEDRAKGVQAMVWRFLMQKGEPCEKCDKRPLVELNERMVELGKGSGNVSPTMPHKTAMAASTLWQIVRKAPAMSTPG